MTTTCDHNWKRLDESGPNGEWVLACSKCGTVKMVPAPKPPVQESVDQKPLLME